MDIDMEYEVYKYLNAQAESYVPLKSLLSQRNLTFDAAKQFVNEHRKKVFEIMKQYRIGTANIVQMCSDLSERMRVDPKNSELIYLYFCLITDLGLINEINSADRTAEQTVRNFFRQNDAVVELLNDYQQYLQYQSKLQNMKKMPKHTSSLYNFNEAEFHLLKKLLTEYDFLSVSEIFTDNLLALLQSINGNADIHAAKPYVLFAVLTRKHGMMQNRAHYLPNLQSIFHYQSYQIEFDNGKNFNSYQEYVELYDSLRRFYESDKNVDSLLCDFCFAYLSPLSEWYYRFCEPDYAIPMKLRRIVQNAEPVSFPMLFCYDTYSDADISEFESKHTDIYRQWTSIITADITDRCLQLLYHQKPLHECTALLPKSEKFPHEAELFLFEYAEPTLEKQMLDIADLLITVES